MRLRRISARKRYLEVSLLVRRDGNLLRVLLQLAAPRAQHVRTCGHVLERESAGLIRSRAPRCREHHDVSDHLRVYVAKNDEGALMVEHEAASLSGPEQAEIERAAALGQR